MSRSPWDILKESVQQRQLIIQYITLLNKLIAVTTVIDEIKSNTIRGPVKEKLIERLGGKYIDMKTMPPLKTKAAQAKNEYKNGWISESLPATIADIGYCVEAILYLDKDEIIDHEQYICETLA